MKTLCTWLMAFVLITEANLISAQLVNCNPDTNSMPWYSGGLKTITQSMQQEIDVIPKFILSPNSSATRLDSMVDNSILPYMPPIIYQGYQGICAQASLVAYMFTFEINRKRNVSASEPGNKYHPNFTYNFLNYGSSDSGSTFHDGLRILKEFGCPDSITYDRPIPNPNIREWISSYSKYFAALQNRISYYETINILSDTGIFCIKHWLFDHNNGDSTGGLAVFGVMNFIGISYGIIAQGPEQGKSIMISFSTTDTSAHALTIVGYNDSIRYDYDANDTIEQWEFGAFKVANSHGNSYPPNTGGGYVYVPYFMISDSAFLNGKEAYICHALVDYIPEITYRAKMTHSYRDHFSGQFGYDSVAGSNEPFKKPEIWPITYLHPGDTTLTGLEAPYDTLEIELDFTYYYNLFPLSNLGKIYFRPKTYQPYPSEGIIWSGSLVDYRWGEIFELPLNNTPGAMEYGEIWKYSVDYDLLPFTIESDTVLTTHQIYRLSDTIRSGASLIIGDSHTYTELHLHDATLLIEEGANLIMRSWSSLIAQSGTNKIIVKGNLILDESVIVKSEGNATLSIEFENDTLCWKAINDSFVNIELTGYSLSSLIGSCTIHESYIDLSSGTITISNDSLLNSSIKAFHPQFSAASCEISGNWFNYATTGNNTVITIEDYPNFKIEDNEIYYTSNHGIELFYSGLEGEGEHSIHDNTIRYTGLNGSSPEVGIHSYLSYVDIQLNRINNADFGIAGFHGSELIVKGDSTADEAIKTQQIFNNRISQCIFSLGSFPAAFHWNIVGDTASLSDRPHIKAVNYDELINDTTGVRDWEGDPEFDVTYNCWILNDTNPESRLLPVGTYTWRPIWCPGQSHEHEMNTTETAYYVAKSNVESENFVTAEGAFKELISDFPESIFAQASIKSLFAINRHIYGPSHSSFKSYCDSLSANPGDSLLGVTAGWLSIHCDIKDQHYQQAVNSLDSILSNPPSLEDSIYALIDLSYVYTKIEGTTNQKSMLFSTHSNLIPKMYKKYVVQREFWIEELLKSQEGDANQQLFPSIELDGRKPADILSVHPNPVTNDLTINYVVGENGMVSLAVYSLTGQRILQKYLGRISGSFVEVLSVEQLPEGIFLICLQHNGIVIEGKRFIKVD